MSTPWHTEKWFVSHFNFLDEVRSRWNIPKKVIIHDVTLRDGEQQQGLAFRKEDKIKAARLMDEAGIPEIELCASGVSKDDLEAAKTLAREGMRCKIFVMVFARKEDVDWAADAGAWGITLSIPSSPHIQEGLGWKPEEAIQKAVEVSSYAKERGLHVMVEPWDSTRADLDYWVKFAKTVVDEGHADRACFVDTFGVAIPDAIFHAISKAKEVIQVPLHIHCHNDFGLAAANALAAVTAGARAIDCTLTGIGDRSGMPPTEEVALALHLLYGVDVGLDLGKLYQLCKLIQSFSGVKVPPQKAVVGDNLFAIETGTLLSDLLKARGRGFGDLIVYPYLPEIVGQSPVRVLLGKKSGKTSVNYKLKEMGMNATPEQAAAILEKVKEYAPKVRRTLTDDEFRIIVNEITGKKHRRRISNK